SDVFDLVVETAEFINSFNGEIPGATPKECGNYSEQDLEKAKEYAKKYLFNLTTYKRTVYPQ
ncbi:MAG: S-ribosylhomocysteine lyase, partial [Clostridia bacterium]|nr:S-ribosylhomocysteine lyase [Clostridia bacterium]